MKTQIYLPCGVLDPVGLGIFSQKIKREILPMITAIYDDEKKVEIVETGSFQAEAPLTFRRVLYKLEPIFDYGLFEINPAQFDVKRAQELAVEHFAAQSTKKLFKNLPISVSAFEPKMQLIEDAGYLFMQENGADGNLVFIDSNTTVIADPEDFKLYLVDVLDTMRKKRLLCGVVVCHMPSKAIRIEHKTHLKLSGLLR
jgi:hypothetical protein